MTIDLGNSFQKALVYELWGFGGFEVKMGLEALQVKFHRGLNCFLPIRYSGILYWPSPATTIAGASYSAATSRDARNYDLAISISRGASLSCAGSDAVL